MSVRLQRKASDKADGILLNEAGDPPGQRSFYIPPGDTRRDGYRLSTFKNFPALSSVNSRILATGGFYYTGYKDRTKCFSCGQIVENWKAGDDSYMSRFHKYDCDFNNENDLTNARFNNGICRGNQEVSQNNRIQTTSRNDRISAGEILMFGVPSKPLSSPKTNLPERYQSATSSRRDTPPPSVVAATMASETTRLGDTSATSSANRKLFPCHQPMNPHMQSVHSRMQTFLDNSAAWPAHRVTATPQEISEAGFFYLGEGDKVKCWYCNGRLQNWEIGDIPWQEHAKRFPMCEFLLQQKGIDYVSEISSLYPNLRRPILHNPASTETLRSVQSSPRYLNRDVPPPQRFAERFEEPVVIIDPRQKQREMLEKIENEMKTSEIVSEARKMAFSDQEIKYAFKRQYEKNGSGFTSLESLVDSLLANEGSAEEVGNEEQASSTPIDRQISLEKLTPTSAEKAIRDLEESRMCKSCRKEPACVVFIPCGHLACCLKCGVTTQKCMICHSSVTERIRSYIA